MGEIHEFLEAHRWEGLPTDPSRLGKRTSRMAALNGQVGLTDLDVTPELVRRALDED